MSHKITVPQVGESITEVTVGEWVKQDGDQVEMDEVICELESDKASFELNADRPGILRIKAQTGDTLEIGDVICEIEEGEGSSSASDSAPKAEKAKENKPADEKSEEKTSEEKSEAKAEKSDKKESSSKEEKSEGQETLEMKVPAVGESITEVTVGTWEKQDGDHVEMDEVLCEIESDKATFELTAEASGTLRILAQEGDVLAIGDPICKIEGGAGASQPRKVGDNETTAPGHKVEAEKGDKAETYATGHPSPAAKKILDEKGIDAKDVRGTGTDGRITKEDAEKAFKGQAETTKSDKAPAKSEQKSQGQDKKEESKPAAKGERNTERKRMSSLRKTVARRLVQVKNETAMLTTFNEVDMKPIMDLRKQYKDKFKEKHDVGLGFMSFFTKAVCVALQEWPAVNAQIDGDEMVYNDFCDISIAVSSPKGLVVPVIRNAETMSFDEIEKEVVRLAVKARDGKLSIEEMQGGTFTLTNGGIFGSMMSTPIINAPQSAILGMHNIVERPVAIEGKVEIRPMMYLALSYDHRIIDGRESVSFLVRVKQLLEDPMRLLLGV